MIYVCYCFFFFSSRRRHTRLVSDWSSDVCSSDLVESVPSWRGFSSGASRCSSSGSWSLPRAPLRSLPVLWSAGRSEERRVGKECRGGGWRGQCRRKEVSNRVVERECGVSGWYVGS